MLLYVFLITSTPKYLPLKHLSWTTHLPKREIYSCFSGIVELKAKSTQQTDEDLVFIIQLYFTFEIEW